MIIGDLLIKTKGLKQVERKGLKEGFKVIYQIKSNNMDQSTKSFKWIKWFSFKLFQVSIKDGSLERGHFALGLDG